MADITDRNIDLPDVIVNLQRSTESPAPTNALQLYIYNTVTDGMTLSDTPTATPTGPSYYAGPPGGGHDEIICGEWKAS